MSNKDVFNGIRKVGVIGAGAAGLVAARELRREGFEVVVYEQNADVGGIWLYNPNVGDDPLGLELTGPNQGTIYQSLRINLARELMGFMDYPFLVKEGRDPRKFPGHHELFLYLRDFARDFNLVELIRFNTKVEYVGMVGEDQECVMNGDMDGDPMDDRVQWAVRARNSGIVEEEVFDAVVVCNGHYRQPIIAEIPGAQKWPGKQLHSFNYRFPEPFSNQVVTFPFFEFQSKWIASVLARKVKLPSRRDMIKLVKDLYDHHMEISRLSRHRVHDIGKFEYYDQLADWSRASHFEEWKKDMLTQNIKLLISYPEMFRDL